MSDQYDAWLKKVLNLDASEIVRIAEQSATAVSQGQDAYYAGKPGPGADPYGGGIPIVAPYNEPKSSPTLPQRTDRLPRVLEEAGTGAGTAGGGSTLPSDWCGMPDPSKYDVLPDGTVVPKGGLCDGSGRPAGLDVPGDAQPKGIWAGTDGKGCVRDDLTEEQSALLYNPQLDPAATGGAGGCLGSDGIEYPELTPKALEELQKTVDGVEKKAGGVFDGVVDFAKKGFESEMQRRDDEMQRQSEGLQKAGEFAGQVYDEASKRVSEVTEGLGQQAGQAYDDASKWLSGKAEEAEQGAKELQKQAEQGYDDASKWLSGKADEAEQGVKDLQKQAGQAYDQASKSVDEAQQWAQQQAQEAQQKVEQTVQDAQQQVQQSVQEVQQKVEQTVDSVKQGVSEVVGGFFDKIKEGVVPSGGDPNNPFLQ